MPDSGQKQALASKDSVDLRLQVVEAEKRTAPYLRRTPCMPLFNPNGDDHQIFLKLEGCQHAGSFKVRGALNQVLAARPAPQQLIAASGGNHGAAVAFVGKQLGLKTRVFVPTISGPAKRRLIESFGVSVEVAGDCYESALAAAERAANECGALEVHAFDQPDMIFGNGVLAKELEDQVERIDTILVPVGGGGLISGVAAWLGGRCRIVAVEPASAPTLHSALHAGRIVDVTAGGIAADALGCRRVGSLTFEFCRRFVSDSLLVSDNDIAAAQRSLWRRSRIAVEPAGAVALAALHAGHYRPGRGERVAVVCSGANVDIGAFAARPKPAAS